MRRFLTGFAACWTLDKLAWTLALSSTEVGNSILSTVLGRLSHDRFQAVREAVQVEDDRRHGS